MKKLLVVMAAVSFTLASFAQNSTSGKRTEDEKKEKKEHRMDQPHYEMEDGVMMEVRDGKSRPLTSEVTLEDGSVLMTDGTIKKENGMTKKLDEGECVYKDGKIDRKIEKKMKEKKEEIKEEKKEKKEEKKEMKKDGYDRM